MLSSSCNSSPSGSSRLCLRRQPVRCPAAWSAATACAISRLSRLAPALAHACTAGFSADVCRLTRRFRAQLLLSQLPPAYDRSMKTIHFSFRVAVVCVLAALTSATFVSGAAAKRRPARSHTTVTLCVNARTGRAQLVNRRARCAKSITRVRVATTTEKLRMRTCTDRRTNTTRLVSTGIRCRRGERAASITILVPTGPQGRAGLPGPQGSPGTTGAPGQDGPQGTPGARGDQGSPGAPGARGDQGAPGHNGKPGAEGPAGPSGNPGPQGAEGPQGPEGPAGRPGADGAPGRPGATGREGAQGPAGPSDVYVSQNALDVDLNGSSNTISVLTLPAGEYLMIGQVRLADLFGIGEVWASCTLSEVGLPGNQAGHEGGAIARQDMPVTFTVMGTIVLSAPSAVEMVCQGTFGAWIIDTQLTAVKTGALHVS
jgi:hypothetical protein